METREALPPVRGAVTHLACQPRTENDNQRHGRIATKTLRNVTGMTGARPAVVVTLVTLDFVAPTLGADWR